MYTFQEMIARLSNFWQKQGVTILHPHDVEKGAATFNPHTFFRCLGPEPFHAAYIEPCRRPKDGRYAQNPNRMQHYFQYQVILKPSPYNIQDLYLQSLEAIGFNLNNHDIRFVHDDWEQPTIGAWGLGWEVWIDGQECTQFTYFQAVAGIALKPITGEITYGLERLAMYLQNKKSIYDLQWNESLTYGDLYRENEIEWSRYNFESSDAAMWQGLFESYEKEAKRLVALKLPLPALDFVMKASHAFNMLDARGVISVTQRARYIALIRDISKEVAECYLATREGLGYPLLHKQPPHLTQLAPIPLETGSNLKQPNKQDFLLEIGSEELPATFVPIGLEQLERAVKNLLEKENLSFDSIQAFGTPRRLACFVYGLAPEKKETAIEKKGPAVSAAFDSEGNPTAAALGFFKQLGLPCPKHQDIDKIDTIYIQEVKDTPYLFVRITNPSVMTQDILKQALASLILDIEFPKKMRWADLELGFARPIRWIACLYGAEVITFSFGPITSSRYTFGHRQLSPKMCRIDQASSYQDILRENLVIVDPKERVQSIQAQIEEIERTHQVVITAKEKVMEQVVHLVENPFLTMASFDSHFLKAPKEVLISEMCEHQKYFPVLDQNGSITNQFVITANVTPTASIEQGNRNVLSARLSDGVFLFEQDSKVPLEHFVEKLKGIQFQKGLGTMYDKIKRLQELVVCVQPYVPGSQIDLALEAAFLCKADLATEVVQEFPELQGEMGRIYAALQNRNEEVALAIDEHWMPRRESAPIPQSKTGIVLSIADKIDNLIAFFGLGLKPTSSSDPFGLRRQAFGLMKIIIKHGLQIQLRSLIKKCIHFFPDVYKKDVETLVDGIMAFIQARVRSHFIDEGFSKGEIEACLYIRDDDLLDIYDRVKTLHRFRQGHPNFNKLIEVHKRARGQTTGFPISSCQKEKLIEKEEIALYEAVHTRKSAIIESISHHQYEQALTLVSELQPYLGDLFDNVKILSDVEHIKNNRIALLQEVDILFDKIANFQKI